MSIRDTAERYGLVAIVNHWALALAVVGLVVSGLVAAELAGETARRAILGPHKAAGTLVPLVALWLALWWAFQRGRPGAIPGTSGWEATSRRAMHLFLIAGTLVMGLSGVTMAIFAGRAVDVFGLFTLAAQQEVPWLAGAAHELHVVGGWMMAAAILGHGAVALKHHLIDHDGTFTRMIGRSG